MWKYKAILAISHHNCLVKAPTAMGLLLYLDI